MLREDSVSYRSCCHLYRFLILSVESQTLDHARPPNPAEWFGAQKRPYYWGLGVSAWCIWSRRTMISEQWISPTVSPRARGAGKQRRCRPAAAHYSVQLPAIDSVMAVSRCD